MSWDFTAPAGDYAVEVTYACGGRDAGSRYALTAAADRVEGTVGDSGGWREFRTNTVGVLRLSGADQTLRIKPVSKAGNSVMDVKQVVLTPVK